jgi:hypothetical protein
MTAHVSVDVPLTGTKRGADPTGDFYRPLTTHTGSRRLGRGE